MGNVFTVFASFPMHGRSKEEQTKTLLMLIQNVNHWFTVAKAVGLDLVADYDEARVISNIGATGEDTDGRLHYLGQAIVKLDKVDAAIFTDDWSTHNGCTVEHGVCRIYGIPIIRYDSVKSLALALVE